MTTKHLPEPELCRSLIRGDERAFRKLFDRFHRKIFQFAFNFLKDGAQSEEIVQETFLNFWLHRERLDPNRPIAPLLFTMARRSLIDAWRKAAHSERFRQHVRQFMLSVSNETEEQVVQNDFERITQEALCLLNKQQQQVFQLSRHEGLSYEEIAKQMHISKHAVKYHLVNALKILKTHLAKHGLGYLYLVFLVA